MHKIFITGGAGYVGVMLAEKFSARTDIEKILCLDKEPMPDFLKGNGKIEWVQANTAEEWAWEEKAAKFNPDIVIHTAWQIREMYGRKNLQWKWNVDGSDKIFDFALKHLSVKRLVHFSTVASYSARPDNTLEHRFTEAEPFRDSDYLYATEKKVTEEHLKAKFDASAARREKIVFIIRPAAITGPRGRFMRIRFGLQSALSGALSKDKSFAYRLVSALVSFVPATPKWARQFIHEDDITDITELLSFVDVPNGTYEIFNACPSGDIVLAPDMARLVGKKVLPVSPQVIRFGFFCIWHLTLGKVPTSRGGWKSYSYPILVDGSKLTKMFGFKYKCDSKTAFSKIDGRYAKYVTQK
ncbi:MAG TPA: NAD-dependent epimerase/dehydratase family protein [Candidatus Paceibacterota bacterium]|nr:NAD-dependent epimerase/dehydratase family protein [Candidatus Paceibacterota bacterium]